MKKQAAAALTLALALSLGACGGTPNTSADDAPQTNVTQKEPEEVVDPSVLYDGDTMRVRQKKVDDAVGIGGAGCMNIYLEITNKSDGPSSFSVDYATIQANGQNVQLLGASPSSVPSGETAVASLTLDYAQFGASGIDDVQSVTMDIVQQDAGAGEGAAATGRASISLVL